MNFRALAIASISAGIAMGLLSNLPVIYLLNCLVFAWVWISAIFGAWLYQRLSGTRPAITAQQGTIVGLFAGIVGIIVFGITYFWLSSLLFGVGTESTSGERAISVGFLGITGVVYLTIASIAFPVFGAIGGSIGGTMFKRE